MKFKDVKPGMFRDMSYIVYCKLEKPTEEYNSVHIASGAPRKFEDEDEVLIW